MKPVVSALKCLVYEVGNKVSTLCRSGSIKQTYPFVGNLSSWTCTGYVTWQFQFVAWYPGCGWLKTKPNWITLLPDIIFFSQFLHKSPKRGKQKHQNVCQICLKWPKPGTSCFAKHSLCFSDGFNVEKQYKKQRETFAPEFCCVCQVPRAPPEAWSCTFMLVSSLPLFGKKAQN